ncbi:MAG: uracil-DNA glycosylase [PVC group bacterium]
MNKSEEKIEEKMRELLYDFRRFFEQLKEEGIETVESARGPAGLVKKKPRAARTAPPAAEKTLPEKEAASLPERFRALLREIAGCRKCGLASTRRQVVPGEGGNRKRILFIGEGPGADEDRIGRPFVGRSGQLLEKVLSSISLSRDDVYITNIVKCRPPDNRDPQSDEAAACRPFLEKQIELLRPRVIVTLGSPAVKTLLETESGIGRLRGRFHDYRGIPLLPTYHPAYLLRVYTPENRKKVWEDMKMLRDFLEKME